MSHFPENWRTCTVNWICKKLWKRIDPQKHIFSVQLDVTNACNLQCGHCYHAHHQNSGALTYGQWLSVLDQYERLLNKLRMFPRVTFCGGEPLLCPFLFPLISEIRRRFADTEIRLLTNGTVVTQAKAEQLRAMNVSVQVSIDGPDVERHDHIRGPDSFNKAVVGCDYLARSGVVFHHLAVLSRCTSTWIPHFFELAKKTGARGMSFVRLVVAGEAQTLQSTGKDASLIGPALREAMCSIIASSRVTGVPTSTEGSLWHLIDSSLGSPDSTGFSGVVIGYQGHVKVSSRVSYVLGHVFHEGMESLFLHHPTMRRLREGDIEICHECQYFLKCRGSRNASYANYGHFFGPDPGCWILPEIQLAKAVE